MPLPVTILSSRLELNQSQLHSIRNRFETGRQAEEQTGSGAIRQISKTAGRVGQKYARTLGHFSLWVHFRLVSGGCESTRRDGEMVNICRVSQREA